MEFRVRLEQSYRSDCEVCTGRYLWRRDAHMKRPLMDIVYAMLGVSLWVGTMASLILVALL